MLKSKLKAILSHRKPEIFVPKSRYAKIRLDLSSTSPKVNESNYKSANKFKEIDSWSLNRTSKYFFNNQVYNHKAAKTEIDLSKSQSFTDIKLRHEILMEKANLTKTMQFDEVKANKQNHLNSKCNQDSNEIHKTVVHQVDTCFTPEPKFYPNFIKL